MNTQEIDHYAEFNFRLRQSSSIADDVPAAFAQIDLEDAYRVQERLVERLAAAYQTDLIGYKIGCTSEGAQRLLSTDGPVYGRLFAARSHGSPVALDAADFSMVVIEPEFAFRLKKDVPAGRYNARSIRPYVAAVIPAIEIVHHHLGGWDRFDAPKTVADNAIHGAWVAGADVTAWEQFDLPQHEVSLFSGERLVGAGRGEIALGDPLNALAWLASVLPAHGQGLRQGEVVTTGVCMDVYLARAGETIRADFGELGLVEVKVV